MHGHFIDVCLMHSDLRFLKYEVQFLKHDKVIYFLFRTSNGINLCSIK